MAYATTINQPALLPTVLVVEDDFLIGLDLTETAQSMGFRVDGPHPHAASASIAIRRKLPDFAILEVVIGKEDVYPLADLLSQAWVPIIFHSRHRLALTVQQRYPQAQACAKPCPPARMMAMMARALAHGTFHAD